MTQPNPSSTILEYNGFILKYKGYLQTQKFSYRCQNYNSLKCPYLLSVPINEENFVNIMIGDEIALQCIGIEGCQRTSTQDHNSQCKSRMALNQKKEQRNEIEDKSIIGQTPVEWSSNQEVLCNFIRQNLNLMPSTIQTQMRMQKQNFSIKTIKENKKKIWDEVFPRDPKIAFNPHFCKLVGDTNDSPDNLYRGHGECLQEPKTKTESAQVHQYYILASRLMLFQLSQSEQWFIDGTFSIAPSGFTQVLIIMVYIHSFKIFYPACYIVLTGKSERLYFHALNHLVAVTKEEDLVLKPKIVMMDFEKGLKNAVMRTFSLKENNIAGCYFHFAKALIKRAIKLGMIQRKVENPTAKSLIGLLKILSHCPSNAREDIFEEIESMYKDKGDKYNKFLQYFRKNWLQNNFLDSLFEAYTNNTNINFIRTNNPCELFNRYLGKFFFSFYNI